MRWVAVLVCIGCGRIAFDTVGGGGGGGDGGNGDAILTDDAGHQIVSFGETGTATFSNVTIDTFLDMAHTTFNYGAGVNVESTPTTQVGLLRFNVSAIAGRTVIDGKLVLYVSAAAAGDSADFYAVEEAWLEGTMVGQPGVASWGEHMIGTPWTNAGCGTPGSRGNLILATVQPMPDTTMTIPLTAAGVLNVQTWIDNAQTNFGFAIVTTAGTGLWDFFSRENAVAAQRPLLVLTLQ